MATIPRDRQGTEIQTDELWIYDRVKREYAHRFINHGKEEYSVNGISTNTIEGFWSHRSISFLSYENVSLFIVKL